MRFSLSTKLVLNRNELFVLATTIILFIISAFRDYNVGTDTIKYINYYINPADQPKYQKEFGYDLLVMVLRTIFENPRFLLIFISSMILIPFYKSFIKNSELPELSIVLFVFMFFPYSLNIMRQFIVIAIFYYWGIKFIINRDIYRYLITILICILFHKTSIILIFIYFLVDKKYIIGNILIIWITSLLYYFIGEGKLLVLLLNKIHLLLIQIYPDMQNYFRLAENLQLERSLTRVLIFNTLFFVSLLYYTKYNDKKSIIFFNLFFISVVILNLFFNFRIIVRILFYFQIAYVFFAAYLVKSIDNKLISIGFYCFFILLAIAFFINSFYLGGQAGVFN